jgi:hypothetical protein
MIEEEMLVTRKRSITKYCQDSDSEKSKDYDGKKNGNQRINKQNITLKVLEEVCIIKIIIMKDTLQKNVNY